MIPVKNNTISVQGNLNGDKIAMGVHATSLQKLIGILTDLYSDPELAVIREYSTNAIDSHIAAKQTRPIEVSLPSPLSPYLRIKDFGLGMSVDDVRDTYSQYGASTKDQSNDFNGMLGLGSKSALTYTNQFTVIATKGGVKAQVAVSRAEDGTGTMEVVDTVSTTDSNGVEIVIPVKYGSQFDEKARKFYSFWKPGTVLLNGKEPSLISGNEVAPNIYSVEGLREDYIVQGNVAYPVQAPGLYSQGYYKDFGVVAYVANGSVSFAPSREALMYDAVTNAEIQRIREAFAEGLAESIRADVEASKDHAQALARFSKWQKMMGYSMPKNVTYKQQAIPQQWDVRALTFNPHTSRYQTQGTRQIGYREIIDAVIVTDWTADSTSQTHKSKLKEWARENDLSPKRYILIDKKFGGAWTDSVETVSWDDVKKVSLNKNPKPRTGVRGSVPWRVWDTATNWWKDDNDPDPQGDVFYFSPSDKIDEDAVKQFMKMNKDATIILLGRNRWDKMLRAFPNAKFINEGFQAAVKGYADGLTDEDKILLSLDYYFKQTLNMLDPTRIDDPEVVKYIGLCNKTLDTPGILRYNRGRAMGRLAGIHCPEVDSTTVENPLDKYPLVSLSRYNKVHDHVYLYMNAAYAAEKEN